MKIKGTGMAVDAKLSPQEVLALLSKKRPEFASQWVKDISFEKTDQRGDVYQVTLNGDRGIRKCQVIINERDGQPFIVGLVTR